ncbi:RNB-domain-containing protein [Clavulina sp. PMI_390]|nr:RNB-domain-containing protein [Clavulina sp. PMI_390]
MPNATGVSPTATRGPSAQNSPAEAQPPRHRKAASAGPNFAANFASAGYANQLSAMQEDAEDGYSYAETEEYSDQPGFSQPQIQPQAPSAYRNMQQQPMGSFSAPRFQNQGMGAQEQMNFGTQGEVIGPSGRPQLAPNFTFGGNRRPRAPSQDQDDANFQFPPQPGAMPNMQANGYRPEVPAGIALQNQIEALQQQQQQILQQQIASGQVMGSAFATPQLAAAAAGHRRIQSQAIMGQFGTGPPAFGMPSVGGFGMPNMPMPSMDFGMGMPGMANRGGGHGRRHSMNVINKNTGPIPGDLAASASFGANDGFEDGFGAPGGGGHSRQASRAEGNWRNNSAAFDLAQATAQLNSLQQFRAAAGGHHQKMASFSFPNMLPNMVAANMMGMGVGGYNILQQQQQQFQMQLQQQSSQPQRKSLFAPYLPQASLPPLLAAGKLVVGILRVNKRNRSDAYVSTEVLDADIYICGSKDRNRALEGDIVAVELLDVDDVWGTKKEKEEKKRKKEENMAYEKGNTMPRKNDKKKDDVEVEGQGLTLFEDEEVTDEVKPQFAGHVVAVVERMPGQLFSGTLGLLRPSSAATKEKQEAERREREGDNGEDERPKVIERPKIVWFKPTDKRVPLIAIPTEQAPPDFVQNSEAYADRLFVACIKRHPISSLHPFGTLVEELGPIGDVEVETSALLKDCNFPTEEFSENVTKAVPPTPWLVPEREIENRRDLRESRIFTIDPPTARDLDDALSVTQNEDGTFDVGVHIADVSHFVKANTPLDRDARKRATTVYLVQRSVPMLPPALTEEICSLAPGQERLAFSVVFTMSEDARIIKKWFGRTVIKSAAQLSYQDAQAVIDGKGLKTAQVHGGHPSSGIEQDILVLHKLAKQLLERRTEAGTLRIGSARLSFALDESGSPIDCFPESRQDANSLVEEFMLQTNIAVAQQIAVHVPEQALLRRHEDPNERRLLALQERAKRMGVDIDVSSAGALQTSLNAVTDPTKRRVLDILSVKAMQTAKYFCAGMLDIIKYGHYALNMPLYTHFTSPIRRYADIIVHRQLESVLLSGSGEPKFSMDRDTVAKIAQVCNVKRESSKLAQEQSAHLFLCLLISDLTQRYGPVIRQAQVVGVLDSAFDVVLPEFGLEKRVHLEQMPIENHTYDEHSHTLQIYWSEQDVITWLAENSNDEHLKKVKQTAEQHAVKMEVASRSFHDESALFDDDDDEEDEVLLKRTDAPLDLAKVGNSKQRLISASRAPPKFEGLRTPVSGHHVQEIQELMTVPVIVTADLTKSPPVIKVYAVNPYAAGKEA